MKTYTIYINPKGRIEEDTICIAEGFSWLAFIFNFFWLIYHKLWTQGFIYFAILITVKELHVSGVIHSYMEFIFQLGMMAYVGLAGRDFIRKGLEKEGYKFIDVVLANSQDEAEYKFMNSIMEIEQGFINDEQASGSNG